MRKDKDASIDLMREQMLSSHPFQVGVFIGGMEGVQKEHAMFRERHPAALVLPVASTGGAALMIYESYKSELPADLLSDLAYPSMFRRLLRLGPGFE